MDERDHQAFVTLAEVQHFGRAARSLGMSPSALTRRVQALEEDLGQALLRRHSRGVELTPAGDVFLRFSRAQLKEHMELRNELRQEAESPTGELRIACTVTACHTVLPALLGRFRQSYPGVTLRLVTQDATRSMEQLEASEVDLAVVPVEPGGPPNLRSRVLGHTDFSFIVPEGAAEISEVLAQAKPDLGLLPFVSPVSGLERTRLYDWLKQRGERPRVVAEVRGNEGIIAMVTLGSGVALVPSLVLESSPLRDRVRRVESLELPRGYDVALCAKPSHLGRRVVAAFWELSAQHEESSTRARTRRAGVAG
jgi:LysR family transcriptional regulator, positive regulator for ilvC